MLNRIWRLSRNHILSLEIGPHMAGNAGFEMDLSDPQNSYFTPAFTTCYIDLLKFRKSTYCCPSIFARIYSFNPRWFPRIHYPSLVGSQVFLGEFGK